METAPRVLDEETTPLISNHEEGSQNFIAKEDSFSPEYVLPIALLAALAMASTSATAFFAYSTLICRDPIHCKGSEISKYSGLVAIATCTSNILGMLALGWLRNLASTNRKIALQLWTICRSMSAFTLLLGVFSGNIYVAMSGRIFEGLASDNLLHFILNIVYTQGVSQERSASLIVYSLALYMVGISVSPFVAGLFKNFTVSFFMAIGLFAVAVVHLQIFVPGDAGKAKPTIHDPIRTNDGHASKPTSLLQRFTQWLRRVYAPIVSPSQLFRQHPVYLFIGMSLFLYNMDQSYSFNAILVYTSTQFGFTGRENGLLISIAHSVAALYILCNLYIFPKVFKRMGATQSAERDPKVKFGALSVVSILVQGLSLTAIGLSTRAWQIYLGTFFLAMGLPTPSFIKAYFLRHFEQHENSLAITALALMETLGSVLGPFVLGSWQTYGSADGGVFFGASGVLGISALLFGIGFMVLARRS